MELEAYRPRSKLVGAETLVERPRFPVIDAHNHLSAEFGGGYDSRPLSETLEHLDEAGVEAYVDLDGGWGEGILRHHLEHFKAGAPERFKVFGGVDWGAWARLGPAFPDWAAERLRVQKSWGAEGLKIWKPFGLGVRDEKGVLVAVDDPRLEVLWRAAGELGLPVLLHVADPMAFFDPVDETNERWEELGARPDWRFPSPPYPSFDAIISGLERLVASQPRTTFIGAHVGCCAEDLGRVGRLLEACPNYYVDIAARIGELGRQPYSARRFFLRYADRILFGSDLGPDPAAYRIAYRFLETEDEYFNYSLAEAPDQGRWRIYGLGLPDETLRAVYRDNARRLLGFGGSA